jgi:hypothetical protein
MKRLEATLIVREAVRTPLISATIVSIPGMSATKNQRRSDGLSNFARSMVMSLSVIIPKR